MAEHPDGSSIYLIVIGLVAAAVLALPFVQVPITLQAPGVLRPAVERHEVRAPTGGVVLSVTARRSSVVGPGDLLVEVAPPGVEERELALRVERAELELQIGDLVRLTSQRPGHPPARLETGRYRSSYTRHLHALEQHAARIEYIDAELHRTAGLVSRDVAPRVELEELRFRREREVRAAEILAESARGEWETELLDLRARRRAIRAEEEALRNSRLEANVSAPIRGTVEHLAAISAGSVIAAGELVAVVSPDTTLIGVVAAEDRVAALVSPGSPVRMELEAYPAADWGLLPGRVEEVPADAVSLEGRGIYPIRIRLERDHVTLRGRRRGELRKGMAFRARFVVAKRSLWDFLRGGVGDWLDPRAGRR